VDKVVKGDIVLEAEDSILTKESIWSMINRNN
jgi:hypothetical protein